MAEPNDPEKLHSYAEGWINERKGTDVPTFLKFAYIVIAVGALTYIFVYWMGEIHSSDHGVLVQQFNRATQTSHTFLYVVGALVSLFIILLVKFAFSKLHED
jgi:hypothetical protein